MTDRTLATGWLPEDLVKHVPAESIDWGYADVPVGSMVPAAVVQHVAEGRYAYFEQIARDGQYGPVSTHIAVARNGEAGQFVSLRDAAWHAGRLDRTPPTWSGYRPGVNPNKYTLGVEEGGFTGKPFTPDQLERTIEILAFIWSHQEDIWDGQVPLGPSPVRGDTYIAHGEIAPSSRANDPGPTWPWDDIVAGVFEEMTVAPDPTADLARRVAAAEARLDALEGRRVPGFLRRRR